MFWLPSLFLQIEFCIDMIIDSFSILTGKRKNIHDYLRFICFSVFIWEWSIVEFAVCFFCCWWVVVNDEEISIELTASVRWNLLAFLFFVYLWYCWTHILTEFVMCNYRIEDYCWKDDRKDVLMWLFFLLT